MDAIEALTRRVSARALTEPAPDEFELHSLLSCALRAPDHGHLRPWRIIVIRGEARFRFGRILAGDLVRRMPQATSVQLERERAKALRAPLILVVAARIQSESPIPPIEQMLSAGAAAQNILVGAFALGFGCVWKTGEATYADEVKQALELLPSDAIIGFLYLGTNESPLQPPPVLDIDHYVREFGAEQTAAA